MAGWKKLLVGTFVLGGFFLIAAILLVKIYVTPERVRSLVQSGLERSLQRKVSLGGVDVGPFSGIRLTKLSIQSKDEKEILLSADNIELSYDFMKLIHGELFLGQILIKEPLLRLVRESDGRLNIDDLLGSQAAATDASPAEADKPTGESAAGIPLLVNKFSIQGGTLQFIDRKLNQQSPYRYRLEKLDVNVEKFSMHQPFPVHLAANLNDSPLSLELQYDITQGLQTLELKVNRLNLVSFLPYFQDLLPGTLGQGRLSTELQISKQPAGFTTKGQVIVDQLDLRLDLDNPVHWNDVRIALDQDLVYRRSDQVVDVKKLQIDINGVQAGYQGKISLAEPLQVAGEGTVKVSDLREVSSLIPLELRRQVAAYAVAGSLDVLMQLQGQPATLTGIQQAVIKLSDLQASIGDLRPALNGTLNYAAGRVNGEKLKIDLGGQLLILDLEATKLLSTLPFVQLSISSDKLNLGSLFPPPKEPSPPAVAVEAAKNTTGKAVVGAPNPNQYEPLFLPVEGRVRVQVSQLLYRGLLLEKVQGEALLQAGRFSLDGLTAQLAGGAANLTAEAELAQARIPLRGQLRLDGIDLRVLSDAMLPAAQGSISGSLVADSTFSGQGQAENFLDSLTVSGNFDLKDGEIKGSPLLGEISLFLTNPELELLGFSRFYGNYGLKGKQGTIDAKLESRRAFFVPKGSFSLDGPLNLSLETRISPEMMAKSGVGGKGLELLKDDKGWSLLPLKVTGSYRKPHLFLDSAGLKQQLKKGVAEELGRQLQKQLGGADTEGDPGKLMQKLLDGTLNKLFGN